jgi:formylglycine-generating enzyme
MSHYALIVSVLTIIFVAFGASILVAPGPPEIYLEPQTGMELVAIDPGTFVMGSDPGEPGRGPDETPHTVTLTRPFFIGRYEVTQTQWMVVMGGNPSHQKDCGRCPVENVDFFAVYEFITNLNAQSTSMRYRLPTEAEWEYVCRAGTRTPFYTGHQLAGNEANYDTRFPSPGGTPAEPADRTLPAGSYPANPWRVFDLHGNVWEWTNDWYGPYREGVEIDPRGPSTGTKRVIRGGSWRFDANSARCGLRYTHAPQDKGYSLGFRIVAEPMRRRP